MPISHDGTPPDPSQVSAFGAPLRCCAYVKDGAAEASKRKGIHLLGGRDQAHTPRVQPSWSSTSNVLGTLVASEDDVLHAKALP